MLVSFLNSYLSVYQCLIYLLVAFRGDWAFAKSTTFALNLGNYWIFIAMTSRYMTKFVQHQYANTAEWGEVESIANELGEYLSTSQVKDEILRINQPGRKSIEIQDVILRKALPMGFQDESQGLFDDYENKRLRPDYFKAISTGSGILMEVERGKTNQNNMDFLDIWKCHICIHAHYLFLVVPVELKQNASGKVVGRPYKTVTSHTASFFDPKNYINIRGAVVFGY